MEKENPHVNIINEAREGVIWIKFETCARLQREAKTAKANKDCINRSLLVLWTDFEEYNFDPAAVRDVKHPNAKIEATRDADEELIP